MRQTGCASQADGVLKYNSEELVLYLSIAIFCYFIVTIVYFILHYISEGNTVLVTALNLTFIKK